MRHPYYLLDVFTTQKLAGNPLAVVLRADKLSPTRMQAIAAEFNLSETVFVSGADSEKHSASLRIFTPQVELPFAGHPTLGAAVAIGLQQRHTAVRMTLPAGTVTAVLERLDKGIGHGTFGLPVPPRRLAEIDNLDAVAAALGLQPADIGCGALAPAVYGAGVPYHLVPLRNATALRSLRLDPAGWSTAFPVGRHSVYLFTATPEEPGNAYAARMFAPGVAMNEDPATGGAAAALIGMLADSGLYDEGNTQLEIRQGHEMGRPSTIGIRFQIKDGALHRPALAGHAVLLAEGVLDLPD